MSNHVMYSNKVKSSQHTAINVNLDPISTDLSRKVAIATTPPKTPTPGKTATDRPLAMPHDQ
jgi:hypothetical protein